MKTTGRKQNFSRAAQSINAYAHTLVWAESKLSVRVEAGGRGTPFHAIRTTSSGACRIFNTFEDERKDTGVSIAVAVVSFQNCNKAVLLWRRLLKNILLLLVFDY